MRTPTESIKALLFLVAAMIVVPVRRERGPDWLQRGYRRRPGGDGQRRNRIGHLYSGDLYG